jgi:peptidoglycan hydrolase FlgJ
MHLFGRNGVSISPPSDIVLGVASAVDPEKYRAAAERLSRLGETATGASEPVVAPVSTDKTGATNHAAAAQPTFTLPNTKPTGQSASTKTSSTTATDRETKAYKKFEAYLMQTFVESMLPKNASGIYGSGTAGEIWRSMLAEHVANEMASGTALGIAENIANFKARINKSTTSAAGNSGSVAQPTAPDSNTLSELQSLLSGNSQNTAASAMSGLLERRGS